MKNKKFILILIVFLVLFTTNIVNAADTRKYLTYDWSIKQGPTSNYLYYDETIEDEDGYVTISLDENSQGMIRKIARDGSEVLWEIESNKGYYLALAYDENYYYSLAYGNYYYNLGEIYLCKVEKDGSNEECLELETDENIVDGEIYVDGTTVYVFTVVYSEDTEEYSTKKLHTITSTEDEYIVDDSVNYSDLTEEEVDEITGSRTALLSQNWESIFPEENDGILVSNQFNSADYMYAVGDVIQDGKTYGFILKVDNNQKVVWLKKAEENVHYFDATSPSSEYVAVVAYKDDAPIGLERNQDNVETYIYVYDKSGNIVETHDVAEEIGTERADISQFVAFDGSIVAQAFAYDSNDVLSSYVIRYTTKYLINTTITGSGTIEVANISESGESITFTVTPEKGYILDYVTVTDATGKKVQFTSNTFTMPSADVTIEAVFKKEVPNPETADTAIIACIAIIILGSIGTIFSIKKIAWLK